MRKDRGAISYGVLYGVIAILSLVVVIGVIYFNTDRGDVVKVEMISPTNEVTQATNFTVVFSRELAPDSVVGQSSDAALISFQPELPGKFEWIARDKLRFYPEVALAPSTRYTAEISGKIAAEQGYRLGGNRKFEFYTTPLRVESAQLNYELRSGDDQQADLIATIDFNYPVDPPEIKRFVSIQYEGGRALNYDAPVQAGRQIVLRSTGVSRAPTEKQLQLRIGKGLMCIGGQIALADDFVAPLTLPGRTDLRVESLLPESGTEGQRGARIVFNLPIDPATAASYVSIQPDTKYSLRVAHNAIYLQSDFDLKQTYQVRLAPGLRAVDGATLKREYLGTLDLQRADIPPQLSFVGDGYYLSRTGEFKVGLATINVDRVVLEAQQVFANNLCYLLTGNDLAESGQWRDWVYNFEGVGRTVKEWELKIAGAKNQETVTPLNVRDHFSAEQRGVYRIIAREYERRWQSATRWIVATDLGIVAKRSQGELWVWVNSLATLKPIAGAQLTLLSRNNQKLAEVKTDADGIAIFKNYAPKESGLDPFLLTASLGDDLSFLELTRRLIPTTDFDVAGVPPLRGGYEAFVYFERDIYRPGETVNLAAVVRGVNAATPTPFPIRLRVTAPDGKIIVEERAILNEQGAAQFRVPVADYALTGRYAAEILIGDNDPIGRGLFAIEEFIPDRMKVTLSTAQKSINTGHTLAIKIDAITLFGPPASGRSVSGKVEIEAFDFAPDKHKSFSFRDDTKSFATQTHELAAAQLDDNGRFEYRFAVPSPLAPPSALRGVLSATVLEPGGRGVTDYGGVEIHAYPAYVGLRPAQAGYAEPNSPTRFDIVVVDPAGEPVGGRQVEVVLQRIYWNSIMRFDESQWRYRWVSEQVAQEVDRFTVTSSATSGDFSVTPLDYGKYRVIARDLAGSGSASYDFYASGWGYAPWALDNPDRIEIDLDKSEYTAGETAVAQIRSPFAGKLLLTIERDQVYSHQILTLKENTATIRIPIKRDWQPNVYVSALLIRSTDKLERDMPVRAFGVVPLAVNTESQRLKISIDAPNEILPRRELAVNFQVSGAHAAPYVTIAAVDEGICQLTDYQTPDPHGFFFAKRQLGVESFDIYSQILPEVILGKSPAGDIEAKRRRQLSPTSMTRVRPVSYWSGLLKANADGSGRVTIPVPQFSGQLRVMVAAIEGNRFGAADKNIFVREPIVLTPTFPRFVGPTDAFVVPVSVYNGTGSDGRFEVRLNIDGAVSLTGDATQQVAVAAGRELPVFFSLRAGMATGVAKFTVMASGNGKSTQHQEEVPIRPPVPMVTLAGMGSVSAGAPVTISMPAEFVDGTTDFRLTVAPFPAVRFAGSLQYLLGYPHGCLEQKTSKVFPLLYFDDLARIAEPNLFRKNSVDYFVEAGITALAQMQQSSGAFVYWPSGGYQHNWSSVYATHFLVEARRAGYTVPDRVFDRALDALERFARQYDNANESRRNQGEPFGDYDDPSPRLPTAVYANYVLALAGKPDRSALSYLKTTALPKLPNDSRFLLATALALSGDRASAVNLLPTALAPRDTTDRWQSGGHFSSPARTQAILLDAYATIDPQSPMIPKLVESIVASANSHGAWSTTQENAFILLALGKVFKRAQATDYSGSVKLGGSTLGVLSAKSQDFGDKDWGGKTIELAITGSGTAYYYWRADGLPSTLRVDESDNTLQVRRRYLDQSGNAINLDALKQGDLIVAEVSIKSIDQDVQNVAIVDLLPSGLEIENPRLQSRAAIKWIGENLYQPRYLDIRDDRLIAYGDLRGGRQEKFYYGIRVVSEGTFILPPVTAEAMYAPMISSRASSGQIRVGRP